MEEKVNYVVVDLEEYNYLRDRISELEKDVDRMYEERNKICEEKGVRQVIRHIDEDGDLVTDELIGFDGVFEEINKAHDDVVVKQAKEIEALQQNVESMNETNDALSKKTLELEMEISCLKNRNLWQRICNK